MLQSGFKREFRRFQRGNHHAIVDDLFRFFAEIFVRVLLHLAHNQLLIERAAIHADANGLAVVPRDLADSGELLIAALSRAHVAGIDAVLVQRLRACWIFCQQHVPVVVKVADDRRSASRIEQPFLDFRHGCRRIRYVDSPAHDLRASLR